MGVSDGKETEENNGRMLFAALSQNTKQAEVLWRRISSPQRGPAGFLKVDFIKSVQISISTRSEPGPPDTTDTRSRDSVLH